MMNNNNVVKLNDAEMEKVIGGCGQTTEYVTENTTTVKEVAPENNNIFDSMDPESLAKFIEGMNRLNEIMMRTPKLC